MCKYKYNKRLFTVFRLQEKTQPLLRWLCEFRSPAENKSKFFFSERPHLIGGFHIWRPQYPPVTVTNQLILFLLSAFWAPPPPTHCGPHIWKPSRCNKRGRQHQISPSPWAGRHQLGNQRHAETWLLLDLCKRKIPSFHGTYLPCMVQKQKGKTGDCDLM